MKQTKRHRWLLGSLDAADAMAVPKGYAMVAAELVVAGFATLLATEHRGRETIEHIALTAEGAALAERQRKARLRFADRTDVERGNFGEDRRDVDRLLVRAWRIGRGLERAEVICERDADSRKALRKLERARFATVHDRDAGTGTFVLWFRLTTKAVDVARMLSETAARNALAASSAVRGPLALPTGVARNLSEQAWPTWRGEAVRCPVCSCTPDKPCEVVLDDECGTGACVPAGVFEWPRCSRCAA